MGAVREEQTEFFVVLKIDDEASLLNVDKALEPVLVDAHVERIDTANYIEAIAHVAGEESRLDIFDEEQIGRLLEETPAERKEQVREAVALLRSAAASFNDIVAGQADILDSTRAVKEMARRLGDKAAAAARKSRDELARLGY